MGVVYLAQQLKLDRRVALKVMAAELSGDEGYKARFEREARLAAALDHPHVIPLFETGEAGGLLYLAMRYVDGIDLAASLKRDGALEPRPGRPDRPPGGRRARRGTCPRADPPRRQARQHPARRARTASSTPTSPTSA